MEAAEADTETKADTEAGTEAGPGTCPGRLWVDGCTVPWSGQGPVLCARVVLRQPVSRDPSRPTWTAFDWLQPHAEIKCRS
eukprot:474750-Rhodomonas_salina.1